VAASYNNIGKSTTEQGKYEEALEMYTKSLDIKTRIYGGDNHLDVAKTRENMAIIYDQQGHYDQALPDVATSFNNIGAVYEKKGDLENALVQHQKALEIRTRVFGSDHPDVARAGYF
jgi:tetratricopeptide (TPR) repeat protein